MMCLILHPTLPRHDIAGKKQVSPASDALRSGDICYFNPIGKDSLRIYLAHYSTYNINFRR
jgi:hypothetical protein